jgi:hypothetical protein
MVWDEGSSSLTGISTARWGPHFTLKQIMAAGRLRRQ